MGNSPLVYLRCEPCGVSLPLPYRCAPLFYRDETSQQCVRVPSCLGFCDQCQHWAPVEDFSTSIAMLRQQFWALEQQLHLMQQSDWTRLKLCFWPHTRRAYADFRQQISEVGLLLRVRQMPERQARCLQCGSAEMTAYPAYPYQESGSLALVPEDLPHHCGCCWQLVLFSADVQPDMTPRFFSLAGDALL